jgi:hypothetical protein
MSYALSQRAISEVNGIQQTGNAMHSKMRQKGEAISKDSEKKELVILNMPKDSLKVMLSERGDMRQSL